ncbi:unnamed protein product [Penicillium egyptiacum]|uniref:Uncharacterized protein n=1 Tax=Penicillium egyptiacum TaxID=1303716 RepID=A0A9W4KAV2_9EURO|nr:unnamed protein product [Penicillium egyptiacum]
MASTAGPAIHQADGSQISQAPPPNPLPKPTRQHLKPLDTPIAELQSYYGESHRHFPESIKQYYELDEKKLDDLITFFHQTHPASTETTSKRYPLMINPWLRRDGQQLYPPHLVGVEHKRCAFGTFIGLTNDFVDPKITPLRYKPVLKPEAPNPSDETPSGAGAVQRPKNRGFRAWLGLRK